MRHHAAQCWVVINHYRIFLLMNATSWTAYIRPIVETWLSNRCALERWETTLASDLYAAWRADNPRSSVTVQAFSRVVGLLGYAYVRHAQKGRRWIGLRLRA